MARTRRDDGPLPTIGHHRSLGLVAVIVSCGTYGCPNPPRRFTFDELGLADTTPTIDVATRHRRFVCRRCGVRSDRLDLDWRDVCAQGAGRVAGRPTKISGVLNAKKPPHR